MANNTDSLLIQIASLLQGITAGSGGGGSSVTVLNPSTNYSLETTQQTSITRLADILAELQGVLQVQEQNPITGFNLETTQQDLLTQLQALIVAIKNNKDYNLSVFVDENEQTGVPEYIIYRETLYNSDTNTYSDSYYKIDYEGVKTPFNVVAASSLVPVESYIIDFLSVIESNTRLNINIIADRSGTITTANTSQTIIPSNPNRKYMLIQNISDTDMYINSNAPATLGPGSIKLTPNGSYELSVSSGGYMDTATINILCSVAGKEFTAKEA